jgi:hypothetical protein
MNNTDTNTTDLEFEIPANTVTDTATNTATDTDIDAQSHEYTNSDEPPFVCSRCARPFAHEEWLDLHRGVIHEDNLTTEEREAFTDAYETEDDELRLFRLKALIALIVIYFGFIMTYSIFA